MTDVLGVPYESKVGVVVQRDGDSGDSAQRTAALIVLLCLLDLRTSTACHHVYRRMLSVLKCGRGRFMRSPIPGHWGNDPTNFSRDQHSIVMLAMAAVEDEEELKETFMEIVKRGGFHQNFLRGTDDPERRWKWPDFLAPTEISVFIRGMRWSALYPVLFVLDIGFLIDLRLRARRPWDYDNMLAQNLMFAVVRMPTFFSKLAFRKYLQTDFLDRIENYYDTSNGNNGVVGMAALYKAAVLAVRTKHL